MLAEMLEIIVGILYQSFLLFSRMAPYLLLGMAMTGVLHIAIPIRFVSKYLGGNGPKSANGSFSFFSMIGNEVHWGTVLHSGQISPIEIISFVILLPLVVGHVVKRYIPLGALKGGSEMATERVKVPDMNCQHCVRMITNAISSIPGVRSVKANPDTKLVYLDLDESADRKSILLAISNVGFHPEPFGE